ncbi:hypothetical protein ciss_07110 [Carboxydothermus islandicus]|uniref:Uncharacterized protein n=1 Tax=Carboxydothermus islandicus TaxID=661089 RepID=A0A1L8D0U1_9THEO|nr:hypothetical protein [Carboxydothermus islandicus]GAV24778.1 hypothetical protein ciss_07110 [Carboxydothermus islandicus]
MPKYKEYKPGDRCNHCPFYAYIPGKLYCKYDFQPLKSIGEGTSGFIFVPSEECRVEKIRVYPKNAEE